MKRLLIYMVTLLLILILPTEAKKDQLPVSIIPQDAKWLIHVDMETFVSTHLKTLLFDRADNHYQKDTQELRDKLKIDPINDIKSVTLFGAGKNKDNTVLYIRGNFDKNHIVNALKNEKNYKSLKYKSFDIHNWEKSEFGVFVDNQTAIIAWNDKDLYRILDLILSGKGKNTGHSDILNQLNEVPEEAFVMAVIKNISSFDHGHDTPFLIKNSGLVFFMARERNENINLKLKVEADSEEKAQNIQQIVQGLIALVNVQKKEKVDHFNFLNAIKISLEKNTVLIELTYPSEQLAGLLSGHKDLDLDID